MFLRKQIKWMDSSWRVAAFRHLLSTACDSRFTSSINWLVVWEQKGSNHSSPRHSSQVAAPLRCMSLDQNLHLKSWMLIKNSLTNCSLGIPINHQCRYPIGALVYLLTLKYSMEYTYSPHCPHSTASVTPKSANWCSNDPDHVVTSPPNLRPALVSRPADLFISFYLHAGLGFISPSEKFPTPWAKQIAALSE